MTESWRLIIDGPVEGAMNMALDRAVLHAHAQGQSPPTLRLYRWARPTATLGRFQRLEGVDLGFCEADGVDVVRRPTGGRGVLHDDEVTYSVVTGTAHGVPRGTAASYRHLCSALVETYLGLGVDASLTARAHGASGSSACYLHTTAADLSLGAAKLSGSAQVWHQDSVLQHGSFVISRDVGREARVFMLDEDARAALTRDTATLADALGVAPTTSQIEDAAIAGFERAFDISLASGTFTELELELAEGFVNDARLVPVTPSR